MYLFNVQIAGQEHGGQWRDFRGFFINKTKNYKFYVVFSWITCPVVPVQYLSGCIEIITAQHVLQKPMQN